MNYANNYQYTISDRLGTLQVAPLGEADFVIQWARQTEGKRYYKKSLPSKIFFLNNAFLRLYKIERSIYRCEDLSISVDRKCVTGGIATWNPWFDGKIQLNAGSWDLDRQQVEITFTENQDYSCLEDNKSLDLNLFTEITPDKSVRLFATNSTIEKKTVNTTYYTNRPGGCSDYAWDEGGAAADGGWQVYFNSVQNDYTPGSPKPPGVLYYCQVTTKYARQKQTVTCASPSPGAEWKLISTNCPGTGKVYAKPASIYDCKVTYHNPDNPAYNFNNTYECKIVGDTTDGAPVIIDNGIDFSRLLSELVNKFCNGMTVKSQFFQINPETVTGTNYVTGARSTVNKLVLFQKSDVKRPGVSGNATQARTNWEKLMNAVTLMFNAAWRIETDTVTGQLVFRIEHVSWFSPGFGIDLTASKFAKYVKGLRRYTYTTEKIPARETFTFMEAFGIDFTGRDIIYNSGCVSKGTQANIKNNNVEDITTDVSFCLANPNAESSAVSDDGFVLVATAVDSNGVTYIISESPIFGGNTLNNPLSWAHLHRDYYKHERPVKYGNLNGQDIEFISTIPTKKTEKISIPLCCGDEFNPDKFIITSMGNGVVNEATFSFKDETIEFDLLLPADDNLTDNTGPHVTDKVFTTYRGVSIDIDVLAGSSDPDAGDSITRVEITLAPLHGTAVVLSNKKIRYTPAAGYTGDDMFIFNAFDTWSEISNNGLVAGTIYPPNQGPIAGNMTFEASKNTTLNQPAPGLFANSSDDHGFTLQSYAHTSTQGAAVTVNTNGSFKYIPTAGFVGADTFSFTLVDAEGLTDTGTITITVTNPDLPVGVNDEFQTRKNHTLNVDAPGLLENDTTLTGSLSTIPETKSTSHGNVTIGTDGSFTYMPTSGYVGNDTFVYTVDNGVDSDTAIATIHVLPDVWAHLDQVNEVTTPETTTCDGSEVNKGSSTQTATQRLKFYSDAGGTVPINLTGVGMKVNITLTQTSATGPGAPIPPGSDSVFKQAVSGSTFDFLVNQDIKHELYNCSAVRVHYDSYSYSLAPGDYEII